MILDIIGTLMIAIPFILFAIAIVVDNGWRGCVAFIDLVGLIIIGCALLSK